MSITRETGIEGPRERYSLRSSLNTKCVSPARAGAHRGQERSAQEAGGGWVACSLNARMSARAIDFRNRLVAERDGRSEEHTSELQSLAYLVCRLLLEKKKKNDI